MTADSGSIIKLSLETMDYRDSLVTLIDNWVSDDKENRSRYKLCRKLEMDSGTLSNVLAKRRHFSIDKLSQVLEIVGGEIILKKKDS